MSLFVWVLLGVTMSGNFQVIDVFPNRLMCKQAEAYVQSLDKRPAHIYCTKILVNPT